jgi:hypothetical protein
MSTRTAIFLLALLTTPAWSAGYEAQSAAIKQCMAIDVDDRPAVFHQCMQAAGFRFCPQCEEFGIMMGGRCEYSREATDRPACWYRVGEQPQNTASQLTARWLKWIKNRGWEKQGGAPFYPDAEIEKSPVIPSEHNWVQEWMHPPTLSCEGSDWPAYCERHRND